MTGFKNIADSNSKFVVAVNVLLPICCNIDSCMPNLHMFVEDIVALLGGMPDQWV